MNKKICTKCGVEKSILEFHKSKQLKSGYKSACKICEGVKSHEYNMKHRDERKIYNRKYRIEHEEEQKKYSKKYRIEHEEERKKYNKMRYYIRDDKRKEYEKVHNKKYGEEHKNEKREYDKKRRQDNKEERNRKDAIYFENNVNARITRNMRSRLHSAMFGRRKSSHTIELLGVPNINFLKQYLEEKFKPGMSWDNYGKKGWHIDHIKPCASFDLSKPEEQKKCFHYTNLQPLWWRDNLSKYNRYDFGY